MRILRDPPGRFLQLDQANLHGFQPLAALGDSEDDTFTFIDGGEPGSFKSRDVDEYVLATTIPSDEAEALVDIEPFHGAGLFDRCAGRCPARCRRANTRSRWCRGRCGARIDAQNFGDGGPLCPGPTRTSRVSPG